MNIKLASNKRVLSEMTVKERWLAALRMEPVDRLPFWPKLNGSYPRAQVTPFREMDIGALHGMIGSDKHTCIAGCIREVRKRTSVATEQGTGFKRTVFRTVRRELQLVEQFDAPSNAWHPGEWVKQYPARMN